MNIARISDYAGFMGLKEKWQGLLSDAKADNIFLTYEWIDRLIRHFYTGENLLILNVFDKERLVCVAPLVIKKDIYFGIGLKKLCFIGTSISDRMDFMLAGDRGRILTVIMDYLMSVKNEWDVIDLDEIPGDSGSADVIKGYSEKRGLMYIAGPEKKSFFLDIDKSRDFIFKDFSKKLEKRFKKLKNRGRDFNMEFSRFTNGNIEADNIFKDAQRIESNSWKEKGKNGLFSEGVARDFHKEIIGSFSKKKWIDFSILKLDKKPAAYIYNYLYKGRSYNYSVAFDKSFSSVSAGTMLMLWAIKDSASNGVMEYDFARGEDGWKRRFTESFRIHSRIRIFKGCPKSMALYFMQKNLMPFMKNIKILRCLWMNIKGAMKWK